MLKTIVKRDGTRQPFVAEKLNKWIIWSAKHIRDRVDWSSVVMKTVKDLGEEIGSQELNEAIIRTLVRKKRWPEQLMAGRLYCAITRKALYDDKIPSVRKQQARLADMGLTARLNYSDEEYAEIEKFIEHDRDMHMAYFQVKQLRKKYSIRDEVKGIEYEIPQFTYMRMAMALAENTDPAVRLDLVKSQYDSLSLSHVNAPTPNFINLGTNLNGYASCCLYKADDNIPSLAASEHISYIMTAMSAGVGNIISTRSLGDPVRKGKIMHQGKLPYYRSMAGNVGANKQAGRAGACTTFVSIYDPEIESIIMAQNPKTPADKRNRDMHFTYMHNKLFAKKAALEQDIFLFNAYTAPDLYEAQFSGDSDKFEQLYNKYENDPTFVKKYTSARKLLVLARQQRNEVATLYSLQIDEVNRHTPHKDPIYSSNLCVEITQPTKGYKTIKDLYETDHERGEVSTCSLAGIVLPYIENDKQAEDAAYNALVMIDECIMKSDFPLPHVKWTARQRMNAGVGILGLAHHLARLGLKYDTPEGLTEIDRVMERHMFFLIKASLKLGKERGNAPWMHKTKWPDGWLPIDTYKKSVDELVPFKLHYDWEGLRQEVIANGGIRNSSLAALMPTESSSKASGAPNGPYPVRDLTLKKSDSSNMLDWCAPDNDILEDVYQMAWDIKPIDQVKFYAVIQKWTDQSISADFYRDRTVKVLNEKGDLVIAPITDDDLIKEHLALVKYGVKSEYYQNSLTTEKIEMVLNKNAGVLAEAVHVEAAAELELALTEDERNCPGGFCAL